MGDAGFHEAALTLTLKDGRRLSYLDLGVGGGPVVFHFHGHGSSRVESLMLEEAAKRLGVRVIGLDRPGIGYSDPQDGDRLRNWPHDVAEVADILGIEKFAVQGMSAGGPYALACAYEYPDRVTACSLVSAVPTPDVAKRAGPRVRRLLWWAAARFPNYLRKRLMQFRPDARPSEEAVQARMQRVAMWLGGEDLHLMQIPEMRAILLRTMLETARQNGAGNRAEIERLVQPWGFDIRDITRPRLFLWHGDEDRIMPVAPARRMARTLRNCTATFYEDEGHFSVLVNRAADLLAPLRV
ncbi:MAG: alpha/beta hydrolase [Alphaproteobacteria bacterium]|jgi:pimeloyl-ACP methyl ester carboxylesterase|nr:alpha/beta hydrolase [Alphaproteobacteria bacterium]MBL7099629.1 alpha/beta hydrolase [Alphaproteobacteria bacterium]